MGTQKEVAKLVYALRDSGIYLGKFTVWDDGVFFDTLRPAQIFAERHKKDLVRFDGQVSGWLAKNRE